MTVVEVVEAPVVVDVDPATVGCVRGGVALVDEELKPVRATTATAPPTRTTIPTSPPTSQRRRRARRRAARTPTELLGGSPSGGASPNGSGGSAGRPGSSVTEPA